MFADEVIKPCSVNLGFKNGIQEKDISSAISEVKGTEYLRKTSRWKISKCVYCGDNFPLKFLLHQHVSKVHANLKTFKCHRCNIYFTTKEETQKHKANLHTFQCVYCKKGHFYNGYNALYYHLKTKHQKYEIFQCDLSKACRKYFKTDLEKLDHIQLHHTLKKRHNCLCCNCSFITLGARKNHMQGYHSGQFVQCRHALTGGHCLQVFLTEEEKSKHVRLKHAKRASDYTKCKICFFMISKSYITRHLHARHKKYVSNDAASASVLRI
jgi:hypothetical protein